MPVKPLSFKGDKPRPKKRKQHHDETRPTSSTTITARPAEEDEGDTWVHPDAATDPTGPIIIVLPTSPPTCLASDAHGNIFASRIENIVDDNATTAEPHDVRQVWVAGKVAGMAPGEISLKGSHGGFLGCDEHGVLGARREARGVEEGFVVEEVPVGKREEKGEWRLRTAMGKERYICGVSKAGGEDDGEGGRKKVEVSIRGDGEKGSAATQVVLKMQARFKPRLQRDNELKKSEKVSRSELERVVGRRLEDDEVRRLKRAKRDGTYHEEILDVRVKGKHDKFA